ncbi:GNAT family N-acetyltransferase [Amycolatopsis sp. NPDC004368]
MVRERLTRRRAQLDLTGTYFLTSGVAGVAPAEGTLGFAARAGWVVDYDLGHHVSPATDPTVVHGYLKGDPVGTNAYRLDPQLVSLAYHLTANTPLADSAEAAADRVHYAGQAGRTPFVTRCDTVTGDDYWTGQDAFETAAYLVGQWTNGTGTYCTTQQEDNATATVLARHDRLDHCLSLRTASDFDQPYPGQSAADRLSTFPGFTISVANAYAVASRVAHHLIPSHDPSGPVLTGRRENCVAPVRPAWLDRDMSDFVVRPITDDERRSTFDLLAQALHGPLPSDELWAKMDGSWEAPGKFGAFADDRPIGIASGFATTIAVPGGAVLPAQAVDGVGVRADWTRRGVVTALMTAQLTDLAERGTTLACLHASEAVIYGRFGYGIATAGATVRVDRPAQLREGAEAGGAVRLLDADEARVALPALYERIGLHTPGMISRPETWWPIALNQRLSREGGYRTAVHTGPDGQDDGYAMFTSVDQRTAADPEPGPLLEVRDLHGATPEATAALWRFLFSIDLVTGVTSRFRPADEPLSVLLTDPRRARTLELEDDLWLRLVDVAGALAARTYGDAEPVVFEVDDRLLPANRGRYRVGPDGAERTHAEADLRLDADSLAMLYLGEWRATTLAQAGRITAVNTEALRRADTLFATDARPWCGTFF